MYEKVSHVLPITMKKRKLAHTHKPDKISSYVDNFCLNIRTSGYLDIPYIKTSVIQIEITDDFKSQSFQNVNCLKRLTFH